MAAPANWPTRLEGAGAAAKADYEPMHELTPDELLTTTRAVRRRLDLTRPVARELVEECLEIALQAPTGGNRQRWSFVVVADADRRAGVAELYRRGFDHYRTDGLDGRGRRGSTPKIGRASCRERV